MQLRNTLLSMLALGLFLAAFPALASQDRTGVIRSVDLAGQQVTIDEQRYRISHHTQVSNQADAGGGLKALKPGYPVLFSAEHGELKQITVYPKNAAKRRELGYRSQNDFPQ